MRESNDAARIGSHTDRYTKLKFSTKFRVDLQVGSLSLLDYMSVYCTYGSQEITAWCARRAAARVSVNFCKFSLCIARTKRARPGLTVYPPSRTLELLDFHE
jgi:hypothetical protein